MNNDNLTVLVSGGWSMLLSEHVYCVAIEFKITEQYSKKSASNFALILNIPPQKWSHHSDDSESHSYRQLVIGSFIKTMHPLMTSHAEFFSETSNHLSDSALQPVFGTL